MALTEQIAAPARGPSLVVQLAALLLMTAAAIGGGWFAGTYLGSESAQTGTAEASATPDAGHAAPAEGEEAAPNPLLVALAPMTTNLAAPNKIWLRLELSLVLDAPQPPELIETIHQDLFAYIRTLKLHQVEGASGYQHLKADLEERARIRSDGHVRQILVRTLLLE